MPMHALTRAALVVALPLAATLPGPSAEARGVDTLRVRLGGGDRAVPAFVAVPVGDAPVPAVVVYHEWWGLNGQIRDVARRLAGQGYAVLVPDLYHGRVASDPERAHVLARGLDRDAALAHGREAIAWLRSQKRTARSRIGVLGFCMGGSLAQDLALGSGDLAAAVMFYGTPETDPERLGALTAPLQAHFGADDDGIPRARVEALEAGLRAAGRRGDVHVYPGAGHAFMHEGRASHHPDAARQAWVRTLSFLQKHLKD